MATIDVKDATFQTVAIEKPLAPGRAASTSSRPVVLSNEDKAAIDGLLTGIVLAGGVSIIGKVGIDQTTPGTTDRVSAGAAPRAVATASIANGQALSAAVDLGNATLAKINMPSAWTAAVLTFQTSADGSTYQDLYDAAGTEYTAQAAASRSIIVPIVDFLGSRFVKIRSGPSSAPVNQGAARFLELVAVP